MSFQVRVVPRAGRTGAAGIRGASLLVKVAAAPVDGAANDALVAMLAALLKHPRRNIVILSGQRSRDKVVRISGISAAEVTNRLLAILPP